jgi:hypothetical protein
MFTSCVCCDSQQFRQLLGRRSSSVLEHIENLLKSHALDHFLWAFLGNLG